MGDGEMLCFGPAAINLRKPERERLEAQNTPLDAKSAFFVTDTDEKGFVHHHAVDYSESLQAKYSFTQNNKVMEIHRSTVILLLLLSVSSFTHGQPADVMRRYQKFLTQHQGPYVNVEMCTDEISDRNIGSETDRQQLIDIYQSVPKQLETHVTYTEPSGYCFYSRLSALADLQYCWQEDGQVLP
ncbi:hypothetical protein G5714_002635 [Onychostoma macrolepis]|uniref:Uncharacterized protein n=1 Tax=Onychostoma macrolepis TaxID=369639 RepID=A0A7J6D795_9TELE|nr:hypothetical protein G5714_002635 [Onychostoma macrolepis]